MSAQQLSPQSVATDTPIYLDHNSTTPVLPEVADAVREASLKYTANPGSQHEAGRRTRRALEQARQRVGELLGARMTGMDADRVIFTSGGTEAANQAIFGLIGAFEGPQHMVTSAIEHPCILEAADRLENCEVTRLDANAEGVVEFDRVNDALRDETRLVSLMLANNETGVLQPVAEIAQLCAERGIWMHTDAAQAIGKMAVSFTELNVSAMSFAAHKFYGPLGIGALIVGHDLPLQPILFGGHQQGGFRAGTETAALAIGMCRALELWQKDASEAVERVTRLRDLFEQTLTAAMPEVVVVGRGAPRLPNTSNMAFVGLNRQALLMALDQAGVACSSGSACASGSSEPSPVLVSMGLEKSVLDGSIRFSLGNSTTAAQIEESCRRILSICQRLR